MSSIRKILTEIEESQQFEQLEPFKQSSAWTALEHEDRELLARLLVMQGAHQLAKGNLQVLESFKIANLISSNATHILFEQGIILSSYRENIRCLTLASQIIEQALQQDPQLVEGWYLRAQVLCDIGIFENEASYFFDADQNFEKAMPILESWKNSFCHEEFYWKWGFCLASLGKVSGEPLDFHRAIEKYRIAYQLGCQDSKFLNDFGKSLADLASLIQSPDYFKEALKVFQEAIQIDSSHFDSWYHQACCIKSLGEISHDPVFLEQADHSFLKASEINSDHSLLWLRWGQLETTLGKIRQDQQKIESSLSKFVKANLLDPGNPSILSSWAEVELFLGSQEEKIEYLQAAKTKILNSIEFQPEDSHTWYLYGSCLTELGNYFGDEEYFYQAVEKFQYGLTLTKQNPLLYYGLALAHLSLGALTSEQAILEKAARYYSRVVECGGGGFSQFWNDWGVCLAKLAELTQQQSYVEMAIEKYEKAFKQPIQNTEVDGVDLEWVYNYGCAFDLLGDLTEEPCHYEKAVHILSYVLQIDPNYNQARYNLALAYSHLAEETSDIELYHKAFEHFQFLIEQDPEEDMIQLDFGISLTHLALLVYDIHHPEQSQNFYRQAENHFMQAATLGNTQAYYQLAGLYSITNHYEYAMHYLERAQFFGSLPCTDDLLHDDWLEGLRQTAAFRQFINALPSQQSMDEK